MANFSKKLTFLASLVAMMALGTGCEVTVTTGFDIDGDGIDDIDDDCDNTAFGDPIDAFGCSTADDDGDTVTNDFDNCPATAAGAIVDDNGCEIVAADGTLDAVWFINSWAANADTCAAAGVANVRFNVLEGTATGPVFEQWIIPCSDGGFDSRTDTSAPTIPLNQMFFSFFEALDAADAVLDTSDTFELELSDVTTHAQLADSDFTVVTINELTFPLRWETGMSTGEFSDCITAGVDTMMGYDLFPDGGVTALFTERGVDCADSLIFDDEINAAFGPGTYELLMDASAADGTKWGATCAIVYDGGRATAASPCDVPVIP